MKKALALDKTRTTWTKDPLPPKKKPHPQERKKSRAMTCIQMTSKM